MIFPGRCISTNLESFIIIYFIIWYYQLEIQIQKTGIVHSFYLISSAGIQPSSSLLNALQQKWFIFYGKRICWMIKYRFFLIEQSVECKTTWKLLCSQFQYLFHNPCPSWWNKIPENLKEISNQDQIRKPGSWCSHLCFQVQLPLWKQEKT